jgi:NAD(P)-dependent dehydrogenase (short-subunit alcohol dehydrogenase family)
MSVLKDKILLKHKTVVAYISTGVAATSQNTGGGYPHYRQSKAAGDAYVRGWDVDLCENTTGDLRPRIFSIIPGLINTGMGAGIEGAADPIKRVAEMGAVIEHVKITGDTHGVWKYDGTKHVQYELPVMVGR